MSNIPPIPSRILPIDSKDKVLANILNSIYQQGWKDGYNARELNKMPTRVNTNTWLKAQKIHANNKGLGDNNAIK